MSRTQRSIRAGLTSLVLVGALAVIGTAPASAHGYVGGAGSDMVARAALRENVNLGAVQYEPQSLEGPKGFPEGGPADGQLASAGGLFGGNLDEQTSDRWVKNEITPGPNTITWHYTAPHRTSKWTYYITKEGWDQNAPLTRAALEELTTIEHDGTPATTNPVHTIDVPADHHGYHVIYAVWDVADTANAFYNAIDVDIQGDGPEVGGPAAPSGLVATSTSSTVDLGWEAPADAEVAHYEVFRDSARVGTSAEPSFTDTGLRASTTYVYTVRAVDGEGVASQHSERLSVATTAPDGVAGPTAPSFLHSMGTTPTSVDLMWIESTGPAPITHYTVLRSTGGGQPVEVATTESDRHLDEGLRPSTTYEYTVVAHDATGASSASTPFSVTTEQGDAPQHPVWDSFAAYTVGDRVTYDGLVYEAVQSYQGHGDPGWIHALSLWRVVTETA
jgi:chitin-binding protein